MVPEMAVSSSSSLRHHSTRYSTPPLYSVAVPSPSPAQADVGEGRHLLLEVRADTSGLAQLRRKRARHSGAVEIKHLEREEGGGRGCGEGAGDGGAPQVELAQPRQFEMVRKRARDARLVECNHISGTLG